MSTPVRDLDHRLEDGVRILSDPGSSYRDGAEEALLIKVRAATDITSLSNELMDAAEGWAETYHLSTSRAHLLRALEVPADVRVLEVGAGCGSITRWLGERCAHVDALEPVLPRARVARERCRDLPHVEVFAGAVADVPAEASYDLIVVVGVLEYVGGGAAELAPYQKFLADLRARLTPSGSLILAIENKLGVKYLAGAPEDHSGRVFDSVEGYRYNTPARTFARAGLSALLWAHGFKEQRFLGAFPDYKLSRILLVDEILDLDPSLMHRLPRFPSPDWLVPRPRLADEGSLWRTLVEAGRPVDFANSFVVIAGAEPDRTLWPEDRLASWLPDKRRPEFMSRSTLRRTSRDAGSAARGPHAAVERSAASNAGPGGATEEVDRTETGPGAATAEVERAALRDGDRVPVPAGASRTLWWEPSREAYQRGTDLVEVLESADQTERKRLLREWSDLLDEAAAEQGPLSLDFVPHNLIVRDNGDLVAVDREWVGVGWTAADIRARGVFWLAYWLSRATPPSAWAYLDVRGVCEQLGREADLPAGWLDTAKQREADFQSAVFGMPREVPLAQVDSLLATMLDDLPLGTRLPERAAAMERELAAIRVAPPSPDQLKTPAEGNASGHGLATAVAGVLNSLAPAGSSRRLLLQRVRNGTQGAGGGPV